MDKSKKNIKGKFTIEDLFKGYHGDYIPEEIDWGEPVGNEVLENYERHMKETPNKGESIPQTSDIDGIIEEFIGFIAEYLRDKYKFTIEEAFKTVKGSYVGRMIYSDPDFIMHYDTEDLADDIMNNHIIGTLYYIAEALSEKYDKELSEAIKIVENSFLAEFIKEHSDYVHHYDAEYWADEIMDSLNNQHQIESE